MARSNTPENVDQNQLAEARTMWDHFTFAVKWVVIATIVILLLMAAFLV